MLERGFGKATRPMDAALVPLEERRTKRRKRALESGRLGSTFEKPGQCTITDISETGANVLVKTDVAYIPKKVLLILLRRHMAYTAIVVWRKHGRIGLKFEHEHDLTNPTTPELQILGRYCTAQHAASI